MRERGQNIKIIFACGGLTQNPLFVREHADVTGCAFVSSKDSTHDVLLGAAMSAATSSGHYKSLRDAMERMSHVGKVVEPAAADSVTARYHDAKYKVFLQMYEHQMQYRSIMSGVRTK